MEKSYTLTIMTENKIGLLAKLATILSRRRINIESLSVSETQTEGLSRYTIVVLIADENVENLVKQIQKVIEVSEAYATENDDLVYNELAFYKLSLESDAQLSEMESLAGRNGARVVYVNDTYVVLEKSGHKDEVQTFLKLLRRYKVLEFAQSGRIAVAKKGVHLKKTRKKVTVEEEVS